MSDQNTQAQVTGQDQGAQGQDQDTTPVRLYLTRAECESNKPTDAPKSLKVWEVSKNGAVLGFMLGRGYDACLAALARKEGYAVSAGKSKEVTVEAAAAKLATLDDAALAALGLVRAKPAKGGKKN